MPTPTFSFEMFPPKTEEGIPHLMEAVRQLAALKPAFMTVTFGAGGSARTGTKDLAFRIQKETSLPTAAHLTYVCLTKTELHDFTDSLWEGGIQRIIALRGDFPPGWVQPDYSKGEHYRYTDEFVKSLASQHEFDLSVAAYPEKHPDAPDLKSDIEALKKKCAAGAKRAITQFFFENDAYYRFLDLTAKAGITLPIVPGLLPIQNFGRAVSFAEKCGAYIPRWLHTRFEGLNEADAHRAASDLLIEQVIDLQAQGVPHFHFYTLNKSGLCEAACRAAGLVA